MEATNEAMMNKKGGAIERGSKDRLMKKRKSKGSQKKGQVTIFNI